MAPLQFLLSLLLTFSTCTSIYAGVPLSNAVTESTKSRAKACEIVLQSQEEFVDLFFLIRPNNTGLKLSLKNSLTVNVNPEDVSKDFVRASLGNTSKTAIYFIDGANIASDLIKSTQKNIRKYDRDGYIIVSSTLLPDSVTYNSYFIIQSKWRKNVFDIYETCSYCNKGENSFVKINSVSSLTGLQEELILEPSYKGSMFGHELIIAAQYALGSTHILRPNDTNRTSEMSRPGYDDYGRPNWGGWCFDFLDILAQYMDFKRIVLDVNDGNANFKDRKFNEIEDFVADGKADMGLGTILATAKRYTKIDFSYPYKSLDIVITTDIPTKGFKVIDFFKRFRIIFAILLYLIPFSLMTLYIIHRYSNTERRNTTWTASTWQIVRILLRDGSPIKPVSNVMYIFLWAYAFMCLCIYISMVCTMISIFAEYRSEWKQINSLEEFQESDLKWLGNDKDPDTRLLLTNRRMADKFVSTNATSIFKRHTVALQLIRDNPNTYMYPYLKLWTEAMVEQYYMDTNRTIPFYFGKTPIRSGNIVVFLQKGTAYQKPFDINIMKMEETGLTFKVYRGLKYYFNDLGYARAKREKRFPEDEGPNYINRKIKLKHMIDMFRLMGMIYGACAVIFILEQFYFYTSYYLRHGDEIEVM